MAAKRDLASPRRQGDGWISVLDPRADPNPLQAVVDVPMTLSGLSHFNVENALAAASAGLAAGLDMDAVVRGLTSFEPGRELNPGRMNIYSVGDVTVVIDLAHNEAGLEALLEIMSGLCAPGGRRLLVLGTAGDRTDDIVRGLGEAGARGSDVVVIAHKLDYMRGRDVAEMTELYREGARLVGVEEVPSFDTELQALQSLMAQSRPDDVVAVMCHQDRPLVEEWLRSQGATADDAAAIRRKVLSAAVS